MSYINAIRFNRILLGIATLSDILLLAVKRHNGKLQENHGTRTTTGDLCTLTAGSGKDLWFGRAQINATNTNTNSADIMVQLKANGTVKDEFNARLAGAVSEEGDFNAQYQFVFSCKVTTTQIIKLEVTAIGNTTEVSGDLICWEEPTGTDPFNDFK